MSTDVRGIVWLDYNGKSRLTTPRADTSLSSIQSALLAHSNAVVSYYWEGAQTAVGGSPVAATFQSVGDSVRLMFQDASCDQSVSEIFRTVSAETAVIKSAFPRPAVLAVVNRIGLIE